jgi:glycosyltransferase involved in cell wall biosynthesis
MASSRKRILWVKSGPLHPLDTGGKIRTCRMLQQLRLEQEIHFLAFRGDDEGAVQSAGEYSDAQTWVPFRSVSRKSPVFMAQAAANLFSSLPLALARYRSRAMRNELERLVREQSFNLVICDFLTPAVNFPSPIAQKSVLFQHNVEAEIWRRLAETDTRPWMRIYLRKQYERMRAAEIALSKGFARVIAVSDHDADHFRSQYQLSNVTGAVPTGVDTAYFSEFPRTPADGTIVFLGSMDWMPNIDAVDYFLSEIYPAVRARCPQAKFKVVGRNPPASLVQRAARHPQVEFTGTVDVVPLRAGGGTRIKIFELMAAGVPVISTTVGAEGLPVNHDEHLLLADTAESFADTVSALLQDRGRQQALSRVARALVAEKYGWKHVAAEFMRLAHGQPLS